MAARVSAAEVQSIIEVDTNIADITPFITVANLLVDQVCLDSGYTDELLKEIERWLAAHFYAIRDPRFQSQGAGGASASFQGQTGMMLEATSYGQQAMILDVEGNLAVLNENIQRGLKPTVSVSWLGTELE